MGCIRGPGGGGFGQAEHTMPEVPKSSSLLAGLAGYAGAMQKVPAYFYHLNEPCGRWLGCSHLGISLPEMPQDVRRQGKHARSQWQMRRLRDGFQDQLAARFA